MSAKQTSNAPPCDCLRCLRERGDTIGGLPVEATRMVVCRVCGNKRCPHATDHRHDCTGSNEPGQPGSEYPAWRHHSNAPHVGQSAQLYTELLEANRLLANARADREILARERNAAEDERDRLRGERKRLRRFVHDHRVCLTMQLREGRGASGCAEGLLKELDAVMGGTQEGDGLHAALAERDRLIEQEIDLRDREVAIARSLATTEAERDRLGHDYLRLGAERDRLLAAARALLALLDRHQFSSVALRGKELDELRRLCE